MQICVLRRCKVVVVLLLDEAAGRKISHTTKGRNANEVTQVQIGNVGNSYELLSSCTVSQMIMF
jgi:hypothetical protein